MSTSTDAILFYGYCWTDETSRPWTIGHEDDDDGDNEDDNEDEEEDDDDDWETRYAAAKGLTAPTASYPTTRDGRTGGRRLDMSASEQAIVSEYESYWDAKRQLIKASGCVIDTHWFSDYPMPLAAVEASRIVASRGNPEEISSLDVRPEWNEQIAAFCAALGINTGGLRLGWWLVSYWSS